MSLLDYDTFDPDSREGQILQRLRNNRPASIKKAKQLEKEEAVARYSGEVITLIEQFHREHRKPRPPGACGRRPRLRRATDRSPQ